MDLASNFVEFGAQQFFDLSASMSTTVSQIEKLFDFLQGEPKSLHLLDKRESGDVISGIKPEVPLGSGCSWQQRPTLVEAIVSMLSFACCAASPIWIVLPGLSRVCSIRKSYTLEHTPESSSQLQPCEPGKIEHSSV